MERPRTRPGASPRRTGSRVAVLGGRGVRGARDTDPRFAAEESRQDRHDPRQRRRTGCRCARAAIRLRASRISASSPPRPGCRPPRARPIRRRSRPRPGLCPRPPAPATCPPPGWPRGPAGTPSPVRRLHHGPPASTRGNSASARARRPGRGRADASPRHVDVHEAPDRRRILVVLAKTAPMRYDDAANSRFSIAARHRTSSGKDRSFWKRQLVSATIPMAAAHGCPCRCPP